MFSSISQGESWALPRLGVRLVGFGVGVKGGRIAKFHSLVACQALLSPPRVQLFSRGRKFSGTDFYVGKSS